MYLLSANMRYKQLSMTLEFSLMGHRKKQALFCWLKKNGSFSWRAICFEVLRAILKKMLGTLLWRLFWAQRHLFSFWIVCVLRTPFLASISGKRLLLVIGVKPKIASFLISIFGSECGAQVCYFFAHVAGNSHLAWVRSGRIGAEWVVTALLRF